MTTKKNCPTPGRTAQIAFGLVMTLAANSVLAELQVSPETLDFGRSVLGETQTETVTVANTGPGDGVGINSITISGSSRFTQSNNCTTLAEGESCQVDVSLVPDLGGEFSADLAVDTTEGVKIVPMGGLVTGEAAPIITVTPDRIDFGAGSDDVVMTRQVVVGNVGEVALNISRVEIEYMADAAMSYSQVNDCTVVSPWETCIIEVTNMPLPYGSTGMLSIYSYSGFSTSQERTTVELTSEGYSDKPYPRGFEFEGSMTLRESGAGASLAGEISLQQYAGGEVESDLLQFDPASLELPVLGWLFPGWNARVDLAFEPVDNATGTLNEGNLSLSVPMDIVVTRVTLRWFGDEIDIGGGEACRTEQPADLDVATPTGDYPDDPGVVELTGSLQIPSLTGCGILNRALNRHLGERDADISLGLEPLPFF